MIAEIARRELLVRLRTKAWRVVSGLLVLVVVGMVLLAALVGGDESDRRDVDVAAAADTIDVLAPILSDPGRSRLDVTWITATGDLDTDLSAADVVIDDGALRWEEAVDLELSAVLTGAITEATIGERADSLGIDQDALAALLAPVPVDDVVDDGDDSGDLRTGAGLVAAVLTFIGIQAYGSLVTLGVVEEKSSRVVEVLLSQVRARDLLAGKVIGIGILACIQLVVVLTGSLVALVLARAVDVPGSVFSLVPLVAVTFVAGFGFYAVCFAVAGSLVSRQEDAQQVMLPVMAPMFVGYLVAVSAATSPDSTLVRVASLVPFTAPFVLPLRVSAGTAAGWEVAVALALLVGCIQGAWRFAGRVYEFTLLRTGARIGLRDALRLARSER